MSLVIIDSGGANIGSVLYALERLAVSAKLTADTDEIEQASHVILPGVGAAKDAMRHLQQKDGLLACIKSLTQPVMGICLGMQLLFQHSEEGDVDMLGLIPATVQKFTPKEDRTVPHMGWNTITPTEQHKSHPLFKGINDNSYFYFVHSYHAPAAEYTLAQCTYGEAFSAAVIKDNFIGCQFHPERSGHDGAQLIKNFIQL